VELARIPGASGAVNVRLPDPTNEATAAPNRPLDLIALAVDQAGNVRASFRSLSISHVAAAPGGVNNPGDGIGNNGQHFELTFLAPPSGTPLAAPSLADPILGNQAGLVGRSQYILRYEDTDATAAIAGGTLARLSFYYRAPTSDPLRANLGAAAAIGLPGYVAAFNEVYYLIQDVESAPFRVNWPLEPTRGLVALIFNDQGHSSPALDALNANFIVQATALACPEGNHSVTANTPLRGIYQIRYFNAGGPVQARARYVRFSGTSGPAFSLGFPLGIGPAGDNEALFNTAAAGDATTTLFGLASGSTYTQELQVTDGPVVRVFQICPPGSINVVP
jgi:hypothetical protein